MIPDEIKKQIEMFGRSRNAPYRNHQQEAIACAEFGYSLSQETITSLSDKIKEQEKQLQDSLLLYNNQNEAIIKRDLEIERLKALIEKTWGSMNCYHNNKEYVNELWNRFKTENNF